jgi:hypothetical protein
MARIVTPDEWSPGLLHDERTLGEVVRTLPGMPPEQVPWFVRLFENPVSRLAFPGAITLFRHDCIHVLLGRGLSSEDEAFVLGFTMGRADGLQDWQITLYRFIARYVYLTPYRFSDSDLLVFDLGLSFGIGTEPRDMHSFPFESHMDKTLGELREKLGIDVARVEAVYRYEQILSPGKNARRLDTDRVDHSVIGVEE